MKSGGNLAALALGQAARLGSGFGVNILLMRALGVDGYGVYGTVLTLVGLASFGAGLGMSRLINREVARDPTLAGPRVGEGLLATAALSAVTAVGVVGWAALADGRTEVVAAAALAAVAMGVQALVSVPEAAFHGVSNMGPSSKAQVAGRLALVVATAAFLWAGGGVAAVFAAQILDAIVTAAWTAWAWRRHFPDASLRATPRAATRLARRSVPFGLNLLFGSVYLSGDVLLLALLRDDTEVGRYRGAVMVISLLPVVANTLTTGVFPKLSRRVGDPAGAGAEMTFLSRVLLAISVPAAVGGVVLAEPLMVLLGGQEFAVSALPFVIMAPLLPLRFLNNGLATALSALDRQPDRTRGVFLAAGVNVALNLLVIPGYGAEGAAATTLVTEILLLGWFSWRVRPVVHGLELVGSMARVGLAAAVMGAALVWAPAMPVLLAIAGGAVVYAAVGWATRAWHPSDLRRLRRV